MTTSCLVEKCARIIHQDIVIVIGRSGGDLSSDGFDVSFVIHHPTVTARPWALRTCAS